MNWASDVARCASEYTQAAREVKKQLGNSASASTVYDSVGNVVALHNKSSSGTDIYSLDYQYDAVGNRTSDTETGSRTAAWTYDAANRLTSEIRTGNPAYASTFTYDGAGNRVTAKKDGVLTTFSHDLADQLTTSVVGSTTTTYTYDNAGNQTLQVVAPNTRTTYTWNDDNRQTRVQATGVDLTAKYRFDGRRAAHLWQVAQSPGHTLRFFPPEAQVRYRALTGQSLYDLVPPQLAHKLLAIAEEEGVTQASYALKLLQSEGRLRIAAADKYEHTRVSVQQLKRIHDQTHPAEQPPPAAE